MKKLISLAIVIVLFVSCEKENESVSVQYRISNAYSPTSISYRNADNVLKTTSVDFESGEDIWLNSFDQKRGEIVYLSAVYQDSTSSVKAEILVDGKIYKAGSSNNEPEKYVTVSGTIPY